MGDVKVSIAGSTLPSYNEAVTDLATEHPSPLPVKQGLRDIEKSQLLLAIIFIAVIMTLYLVFSFVSYPDFPCDNRFKHNPFAFAMISAGANLFGIVVYTMQLCKNWGLKDLPWWFTTLVSVSMAMGIAMWMWGIVILDSSDGDILKEEYERIYKLLLSMVCILGGLISILVFCGLVRLLRCNVLNHKIPTIKLRFVVHDSVNRALMAQPKIITMFEAGPAGPQKKLAHVVEKIDVPDADIWLYTGVWTNSECRAICEELVALPNWEQRPIKVCGRDCMQNRKTCFFALHDRLNYRYSGIDNAGAPPFPLVVDRVGDRATEATGGNFVPNYCLLNWYADGRQNIGWHADDERDLVDERIVSCSFGAARFFDLRRRDDHSVKIRLELPSGSIVVMGRGTQNHYHHQVPTQARIKEPRFNLTYRRVQEH